MSWQQHFNSGAHNCSHINLYYFVLFSHKKKYCNSIKYFKKPTITYLTTSQETEIYAIMTHVAYFSAKNVWVGLYI